MAHAVIICFMWLLAHCIEKHNVHTVIINILQFDELVKNCSHLMIFDKIDIIALI